MTRYNVFNLQALPSATMLETLNLGDCLVKSKGALAIAENIKGLANLKVCYSSVSRKYCARVTRSDLKSSQHLILNCISRFTTVPCD